MLSARLPRTAPSFSRWAAGKLQGNHGLGKVPRRRQAEVLLLQGRRGDGGRGGRQRAVHLQVRAASSRHCRWRSAESAPLSGAGAARSTAPRAWWRRRWWRRPRAPARRTTERRGLELSGGLAHGVAAGAHPARFVCAHATRLRACVRDCSGVAADWSPARVWALIWLRSSLRVHPPTVPETRQDKKTAGEREGPPAPTALFCETVRRRGASVPCAPPDLLAEVLAAEELR